MVEPFAVFRRSRARDAEVPLRTAPRRRFLAPIGPQLARAQTVSRRRAALTAPGIPRVQHCPYVLEGCAYPATREPNLPETGDVGERLRPYLGEGFGLLGYSEGFRRSIRRHEPATLRRLNLCESRGCVGTHEVSVEQPGGLGLLPGIGWPYRS